MKKIALLFLFLYLTSCANQQPLASASIANTAPNLNITLVLDGVPKTVQTSALDVRTLLLENGINLHLADVVDPSLNTLLADQAVVKVDHAQLVQAIVNGHTYTGYSLHNHPQHMLADLGITPSGIDVIQQQGDGKIVLTRIQEQLQLNPELIAYQTRYEKTDTLSPGQIAILKNGVPGIQLAPSRVAIANGQQLYQLQWPPRQVSEPIDQLTQVSGSAAIGTIDIGKQSLTYWKAIEMYTTSYSPCGQGTGTCSTGTASGMVLDYGIVAVQPFVFNALAGTQVYIPGYGIGTIGDVGGGFPDGRPWIDLGYSDANYVGWYGYHTVYFLGDPPSYDPFGN